MSVLRYVREAGDESRLCACPCACALSRRTGVRAGAEGGSGRAPGVRALGRLSDLGVGRCGLCCGVGWWLWCMLRLARLSCSVCTRRRVRGLGAQEGEGLFGLRLLRPFGIITCHPERLPVTGVGRPRIVKL